MYEALRMNELELKTMYEALRMNELELVVTLQ